jgi:hypothetical protein
MKICDHAVIDKSIKTRSKKTARYRRLIVFPIRYIAFSLKLEAGKNIRKTTQVQYVLYASEGNSSQLTFIRIDTVA